MKYGAAFYLLLASAPAMAVCLNPFGCVPTNLEECRSVAVTLPTEHGVSTALSDCQSKFITRPAEEKRAVDERNRATKWLSAISKNHSLNETITALGQPSAAGDVQACAAPDGTASSAPCRWYEWASAKNDEICVTKATNAVYYAKKVYRAEFIEDTGVMHHRFDAAISTCDNQIDSERNVYKHLDAPNNRIKKHK